MAKSKLIAALDAHKGKNYKLIKQKKQEKEAAKKRKTQAPAPDSQEKENVEAGANGTTDPFEAESEDWESDESDIIVGAPVSRAPWNRMLCSMLIMLHRLLRRAQ